MLKKAILFLGTALGIAGSALAQHAVIPCGTDEGHKALLKLHPEIAVTEALLNKHYKDAMEARILSNGNVAAKGTNVAWNTRIGYDANDTEYHIPVVVHIIHNYGSEYISDDKVYQMIADMNTHYHATNSDITSVIQPFKEYVGNAHITFHLATLDPNGQPTSGITRHYSYQTNGGDEQAKFDGWNPDRYMNIWVETVLVRLLLMGPSWLIPVSRQMVLTRRWVMVLSLVIRSLQMVRPLRMKQATISTCCTFGTAMESRQAPAPIAAMMQLMIPHRLLVTSQLVLCMIRYVQKAIRKHTV